MLASGPVGPAGEKAIWTISALTGVFRKLRDDVFGASVSPGNSHIAFLNGARSDIWLMGPDAEDPRRVLSGDKETWFSRVEWSPDGRRLAYMKHRRKNGDIAIEILDLPATQPTVVLSDRGLESFCWAPDGRIIYALAEPPPNETSSNLWDIRPAPRTGGVSGKPRRITNWAGFNLFYLSLSTDGRRLAFVRGREQSDVYIGELEANGSQLKSPWRLTVDDRIDWPGDWTRDSKRVLFFSDRNGNLDIFRQGLEDRLAEAVIATQEEERGPQLSPDGSWILYLAWPHSERPMRPISGRLMRVPVSGGPPQLVLNVEGYPGSAQVAAQGSRLSARGYPDFRCPSTPGASCILAQGTQNQIVFFAFDPVQGKTHEVARVDVDPSSVWSFWNLSSDGSRIAFGKDERNSGQIRILPVTGGSNQQVDVKGWVRLDAVAWAANGQSLFVDSWSPKGSSLLHVTLHGEAQLLRKSRMWIDRPTPSPDGRHLAFGEVTSNSNAWMVENFR